MDFDAPPFAPPRPRKPEETPAIDPCVARRSPEAVDECLRREMHRLYYGDELPYITLDFNPSDFPPLPMKASQAHLDMLGDAWLRFVEMAMLPTPPAPRDES